MADTSSAVRALAEALCQRGSPGSVCPDHREQAVRHAYAILREQGVEPMQPLSADVENDVTGRAMRLHADWRQAVMATEYTPGVTADAREQLARDALVDFVEANDLNYSEWDPRGERESSLTDE